MTKITRNTPAASPRPEVDNELTRLKMELVAARERGEKRALLRLLASHPQYAAELMQFSAALLATSIDDPAAITPESEQIAARARSRAFAAVFGAPVVAPAAATAVAPARAVSLKALRQARGLSMPEAARKLGLGLDVLSSLESGRIAARSIPDRLVRTLGELLDAATEQMQALLQGQAALRPAFQRSRTGATRQGQAQQEMDFAEAVRLSVEMTPEQKAQWLEEE
jgi:transcriptional regulator with XRE-family HTH domain